MLSASIYRLPAHSRLWRGPVASELHRQSDGIPDYRNFRCTVPKYVAQRNVSVWRSHPEKRQDELGHVFMHGIDRGHNGEKQII